MVEWTVRAVLENLSQVIARVDEELEKLDCPMKAQVQIDVAVEEIFVNIARYAYAPDTGDATIRILPDTENRVFAMEFRDSGVPFDPLKKPDPDVTLAARDRQVGGLGIFMVKKSMDKVLYAYENGQNVLRIEKQL